MRASTDYEALVKAMGATRGWATEYTSTSISNYTTAGSMALSRSSTLADRVSGPDQTAWVEVLTTGPRRRWTEFGIQPRVNGTRFYYRASMNANTFTNGYSIGGWFKLRVWPPDTAWLFGNWANANGVLNAGANLEVASPGYFRMHHNATTTGPFPAGVRLGEWFHAMIVGSPTGPVQQCYVNGRLVATSATLPAIALASSPYLYAGTYYPYHPVGYMAGSSNDEAYQQFVGTEMGIAHLYVWVDTALAAVQVRRLYRNRNPLDDIWIDEGSRTPMVMS